ncbi:hypothetical protein D1B33_11910 [Lysinibacillus yapensis]|uniref:Uncharacterized protein n=1 Tax=Ureibacillus yapensis TaxID=2304605 RepID=A0A396S663_9BACL|nr:hypothetical protein [Lysinibacillus yapensis]RHW35801.1 hypothetical protein D1B33_11910 [Lysinibacillus yapensis]
MNMIMERFPGMFTVICTLLAYMIPFTIYKINQKIHLKLDPPWKQGDNKENGNQKKSPNNKSKTSNEG